MLMPLVFGVLATSAFASTMGLDEALRLAWSSHPLVHAKQSEREAAKAEREGAAWQRYPAASVEASAGSGGERGSVLRLDQALWTGGRISAGIDAADSRFDAASVAVDETRQELSLKVITATGEALRLQGRLLHAEASVREHEKLLAMIQRRVQQEVSPLADRRLAESRLYTTVNDLSVTAQALQDALAQLGQLTGQIVTRVDPVGFERASDPVDLPGDRLRLMARALEHSPTLRRLGLETRAAGADIDAKRSAYWPQLTLRLESNHGGVSDNRALLVLQAQPGAGLSARSGVDAALARREATRLAQEAARREIEQRVALDWNEWMAARARVETAERARATSAEVSESYARQYTAGRKTWLDVLNAVREATHAELALVDASSQMRAAVLRLKLAIGELRP